MPLSNAHLQLCCQLQKGKNQCKYLYNLYSGGDYKCAKKEPNHKAAIDSDIIELTTVLIANGKKIEDCNPPVPLGDNCLGYVNFVHIEQGFDIKD